MTKKQKRRKKPSQRLPKKLRRQRKQARRKKKQVLFVVFATLGAVIGGMSMGGRFFFIIYETEGAIWPAYWCCLLPLAVLYAVSTAYIYGSTIANFQNPLRWRLSLIVLYSLSIIISHLLLEEPFDSFASLAVMGIGKLLEGYQRTK